MNRSRFALAVTIGVVVLGVVITLAETRDSGSGAANAATAADTDTVSVSGTGTVQGVPDVLVANLRVHVREGSVQDALNTSSADARAVIATLHNHGVAADQIKSTDVSLHPDYDNHGVIDGYDSSESLTVHIQPLTKVGQVLSAAATAAGNAVTVEGVSFDIADNASLLAAARKEAFDNAKAAATQYATLGGRSLSHVVSIRAQVHNPTPVAASYDKSFGLAATEARVPVPIRPGQKKLSVNVAVVWALA
jgi:hypothetical protein